MAPADAEAVGRLARDARLARRGRSLDRRGREVRLLQRLASASSSSTRWFTAIGSSYHVGPLRLLALARRPDRDLRRRRVHVRLVGRPRAPTGVLRAAALPHRLGCRRLRLAGPAALLRLLRGDADPALRDDRGLGRSGAAARHDHVRRLHGRRLATDAGRDHRLREPAGHVRPDEAHPEHERLALPRVRNRLRDQGAALAVPRLAARCLPRVAARGFRAALGRDLEGRRLRLPADRDRQVPGARPSLPRRDPLARGDRAHLRLAPRLPGARHPRRDRVLLAGADGADHLRPVRRERPRLRRSGAADGQPRPALDDDVPARRDGRAADGDRRALAARRHGPRQADPRDGPDDRRRDDARGTPLLELRRRVPDPGRRLPGRAGAGPSSARSRSCSPRCTRFA